MRGAPEWIEGRGAYRAAPVEPVAPEPAPAVAPDGPSLPDRPAVRVWTLARRRIAQTLAQAAKRVGWTRTSVPIEATRPSPAWRLGPTGGIRGTGPLPGAGRIIPPQGGSGTASPTVTAATRSTTPPVTAPTVERAGIQTSEDVMGRTGTAAANPSRPAQLPRGGSATSRPTEAGRRAASVPASRIVERQAAVRAETVEAVRAYRSPAPPPPSIDPIDAAVAFMASRAVLDALTVEQETL